MTSVNLKLGVIARMVRGTLLGHADFIVDQVVTDSRTKTENALFVALKGDRFDGHDFATLAVQNGATAVLVQKQIDGLMAPHILVKDTLSALQTIGAAQRKAFGGKVVAITGSSGKTTTRQMVYAILSQRYETHQPIHNFNNHIGVPLTLLGLDERYGAAVLELGCSDFGEISLLTSFVDPDAGLITNVGPAHLAKLKSLEGVARAKGELFDEMRDDACAVVNLDDAFVAAMPTGGKRRIGYGVAEGSDVRLLSRRPEGAGGQRIVMAVAGEEIDVGLRLIGAHNAVNAVAAAALATAVGMDATSIARGLDQVVPEAGRLAVMKSSNGLTVIDDTYNANPASMRAALSALKETSIEGPTIAVLGDMLELGQESADAHLALGRFAAEIGIDRLIAVGEEGRLIASGAAEAGMDEMRLFFAIDRDSASDLVLSWTPTTGTVLVKGSRGMRMEQVVQRLVRGLK